MSKLAFTKVIRTDFPHLKLRDGRRADSLNRDELAAALMKLKVPDVTHETGKHDALAAFDDFERERAEKAGIRYAPHDFIYVRPV